ncbi:MAG: response regulator [Dehalococcoidia bacterium]|nr:response regulator [Dehalococcoidia bacterium]
MVAHRPIVIIDDDRDTQLLVRLTLGDSYEVIDATDGPTGLEHIRRVRPKLVIMDLLTPPVDAVHVLRELRADPALAATRTIVLTGYNDLARIDACIELGANAVIAKPFSPAMVLDETLRNLRWAPPIMPTSPLKVAA